MTLTFLYFMYVMSSSGSGAVQEEAHWAKQKLAETIVRVEEQQRVQQQREQQLEQQRAETAVQLKAASASMADTSAAALAADRAARQSASAASSSTAGGGAGARARKGKGAGNIEPSSAQKLQASISADADLSAVIGGAAAGLMDASSTTLDEYADEDYEEYEDDEKDENEEEDIEDEEDADDDDDDDDEYSNDFEDSRVNIAAQPPRRVPAAAVNTAGNTAAARANRSAAISRNDRETSNLPKKKLSFGTGVESGSGRSSQVGERRAGSSDEQKEGHDASDTRSDDGNSDDGDDSSSSGSEGYRLRRRAESSKEDASAPQLHPHNISRTSGGSGSDFGSASNSAREGIEGGAGAGAAAAFTAGAGAGEGRRDGGTTGVASSLEGRAKVMDPLKQSLAHSLLASQVSGELLQRWAPRRSESLAWVRVRDPAAIITTQYGLDCAELMLDVSHPSALSSCLPFLHILTCIPPPCCIVIIPIIVCVVCCYYALCAGAVPQPDRVPAHAYQHVHD